MLCCGRKWPPRPPAHTRAADRESGHFPADFAEPLLFIKVSVSSGRAGGSVVRGIGLGGGAMQTFKYTADRNRLVAYGAGK